MEITETVIFVKCHHFSKMPRFANNAVFLRFYKNILCFSQHKLKFIVCFKNTKYTFASATKVGRVLCYLLAQYVTETSS